MGSMKLYAICYGEHFKYGTMDTVFRFTKEKGKRIEDFSFFYYLAQVNGKNILIDTGFRDVRLAEEMGVTLFPVEQELADVFHELPEISTVVITHSHWDHINNIDCYPEATIILARAAYDIAMESGTTAVKKRLQMENVQVVEKECLIEDKFHFAVIGGHTPDSSAILFEEKETHYVITGDECYQCANVEKNIPIGICHDIVKNAEFVERCYRENWTPLPFHDSAILHKYKRLSEHISRVIG